MCSSYEFHTHSTDAHWIKSLRHDQIKEVFRPLMMTTDYLITLLNPCRRLSTITAVEIIVALYDSNFNTCDWLPAVFVRDCAMNVGPTWNWTPLLTRLARNWSVTDLIMSSLEREKVAGAYSRLWIAIIKMRSSQCCQRYEWTCTGKSFQNIGTHSTIHI